MPIDNTKAPFLDLGMFPMQQDRYERDDHLERCYIWNECIYSNEIEDQSTMGNSCDHNGNNRRKIDCWASKTYTVLHHYLLSYAFLQRYQQLDTPTFFPGSDNLKASYDVVNSPK